MPNVPVATSALVDLVDLVLHQLNRGVSAMWSVDDNVMKLSVPCTDKRVLPFIHVLATVEDMELVDIVHRITVDRMPNIMQLAMHHFTMVKKLLGQSPEEI